MPRCPSAGSTMLHPWVVPSSKSENGVAAVAAEIRKGSARPTRAYESDILSAGPMSGCVRGFIGIVEVRPSPKDPRSMIRPAGRVQKTDSFCSAAAPSCALHQTKNYEPTQPPNHPGEHRGSAQKPAKPSQSHKT